MKLEDALHTDYMCVFVSHHLAWMATSLMHQSLCGLGCGPWTTRLVLFKWNSTHMCLFAESLLTSGRYCCLMSYEKEKAKSSKQVLFKCQTFARHRLNLRSHTYALCQVSCKRWGNIERADRRSSLSKTNRYTLVIVDIFWRAYSNDKHTLPDFAMKMRCICVWWHLWLWVILCQFLYKVPAAALHFWLKCGELERHISHCG